MHDKHSAPAGENFDSSEISTYYSCIERERNITQITGAQDVNILTEIKDEQEDNYIT